VSHIAVIGGHGKVARLLAPILVAGEHTVTAVVRNPDHVDDVAATGADPLVADVESLGAVELGDLLRGHDALVWSAGAGGGNPTRTYAVDRDAAIRSMEAAEEVGIHRYVMLSYFGAGPDHGTPEDSAFFPYAEAKAAADSRLRESGLDWTIVAPSRLTDEAGSGRIEVDGPGDKSVEKGEVSRADVAAVVAAVLERDDTVGRVIAFNGGGTAIEDALRG
jgi:uncharacterized protein YbjT (DUF2867 family)